MCEAHRNIGSGRTSVIVVERDDAMCSVGAQAHEGLDIPRLEPDEPRTCNAMAQLADLLRAAMPVVAAARASPHAAWHDAVDDVAPDNITATIPLRSSTPHHRTVPQ